MMQQEIRFATFNACNLAPAGARLYDNLAPLSEAEYRAKVDWTARQLDQLDADVIGLQEIFSLATLRDVLARSHGYRDAFLAGLEAEPGAARLTPQVALVSRLPLAAAPAAYPLFPAGVSLPESGAEAGRFARAPLHACLTLADGRLIDVIVIHLKSKRPDYRSGDNCEDPMLYAQANLRSLVRRGTEAVALRAVLSELDRDGRRPRVVLGDFNDSADAVTTGIVLGAASVPGEPLRGRLFDCNAIQLRQDQLRHLAYTNIHDGHCMTIDHVLVSEEFNPASRHAIGEVLDVCYLNDHLRLQRPEASDHGQVLVRLRLYDRPGTAGAG